MSPIVAAPNDELRERYLDAFRAVNGCDRVPDVRYLNGWWEFRYDGDLHKRYRSVDLIRMMIGLEARVRATETASPVAETPNKDH